MIFNVFKGDIIAQLAHVGWGGFLVLALSHFMTRGQAIELAALFAISKESVESLWGVWEPRQPWPASVKDMAFFGVGILLGALL